MGIDCEKILSCWGSEMPLPAAAKDGHLMINFCVLEHFTVPHEMAFPRAAQSH